jgi:subtilase family serine protease
MGYRKALAGAFTTLVAAALALLGATAGVAGGAATAAVQSRSRLATSSSLVASANGGTNIRFSVGLKMINRAGAIALEREVSEPASAQYRHYLTPAQWERRFSPSRSSVNAVSEWLASQGIAVIGVSADHMTIDAQAPASTVARAFGTSLGEYRRGAADIRLASSSLTVPSDIAPLISGVIGVNQQAASHDSLTGGEPAEGSAAPSARRTRAATKGATGQLAPPPGFMNAPPCSNYYGEKTVTGQPPFGDGFPHPLTWAPCGYTPTQLQGAYNLAGPIGAGIDGAGVTVAIIDAYASPTLLSDAEEYERKNQPSAVLNSTQFTEMLASTYNEEELCEASSWAGEQTLDVEAVHSTAPGAHILYVGAENCLDSGLFGAVQAVVDGHLAQVVTDSWGDNGGDLFDTGPEREAFDNVLIMAGGTGIGVQFSAGDEGSNYTDLGINVPDYPTDSPYAISVGGTSLQVSKQNTRVGETGWSTSKSYLCTGLLEEAGLPGCTKLTKGTWNPAAPGAYDYGGGGGTSFVYEAPWYQLGVVPASLLARNAPITHIANRVDPDVSMDADPSTGMKIGETQEFETGTPLVRYAEYRLGGTSLASPLFAGVMADADQAAGGSLGFVNPLLYKMSAESSSPYLTAGSIYDVLAAGKQAIERNDYLLPAASEYPYTTVRVLGYEGLEEYCSGTEECEVQNVELHATPGFDSMTGIGSPGPEFLRFAATLKP